MAAPGLTILIPAAGGSTRMRGGDKLLELVAGHPLLRHLALMALDLAPVVVTLRDPDPARQAVLADLPLTLRALPDAGLGMSASFRAVAEIKTAVMVLPADMPEVTAADLASLIAAHRAAPDLILRGCSGQTPGHPVLWPQDLVSEFAGLTGDEGARSLLIRHQQRLRLHPLPDHHALTDLDTPEDWALWRAGQAASNTRAS